MSDEFSCNNSLSSSIGSIGNSCLDQAWHRHEPKALIKINCFEIDGSSSISTRARHPQRCSRILNWDLGSWIGFHSCPGTQGIISDTIILAFIHRIKSSLFRTVVGIQEKFGLFVSSSLLKRRLCPSVGRVWHGLSVGVGLGLSIRWREAVFRN